MKTPTFKCGDRVAYSAAFLRSTGQQTGPAGHARGTIIGFFALGHAVLAEIRWDGDEPLPTRINAANLAHVGPNTRFAAC